MIERGRVVSVDKTNAGSALVGDHGSGTLVLQVDDTAAFNPDGGVLVVGDDEYAYVSIDDDAATITLTDTTGQAYDDDTPVLVWPLAPRVTATVTVDAAGETFDVHVPHALTALRTTGVRAPEDQEHVTLRVEGGQWVIADVLGREPQIQADHLVGHIPPEAITDGEPPSHSPTPVLAGGFGTNLIRWPAVENHDPVTYLLYLSGTPEFEPGESTLLDATMSTQAAVRTLPDGTPLTFGATYYLKIIASDADGEAPPGDEITLTITRIVRDDLDSDVTDEIEAAQSAASSAQSTADDAASAAAAALAEAEDAAAAASAAAGIAEGKADVLIQDATPAAEYESATTLWIDTTGGENTPKRWDGSAWEPVTDQTAIDAANAAAAAQAAASDAQDDATQALADAAAAQAAAGAAHAAADAAQLSADGKNTITYDDDPPSGSGTAVGDVHWRWDGAAITGQWVWDGSNWIVRELGSQVIAFLDAGKITTGILSTARLAAGSITGEKLNVNAINGMTITGAIVRTAGAGMRTQLDTIGLRTFNASGTETARLTASTGGFDLAGGIRAIVSGSGVELTSNSGDTGTGGEIRLFRSGDLHGRIFVPAAGNPGIVLRGPAGSGLIGLRSNLLLLDGVGTPLQLSGTAINFVGASLAAMTATVNGPITLTGQNGSALTVANNITIQPNNNLSLLAGNVVQSQTIFDTGASVTPNVAIQGSAQGYRLLRNTSSKRYKTQIRRYEPTVSLLEVPTVSWVDKAAAKAHKAGERPEPVRVVGWLAEDVHDAGLTELVIYDDQGRPDALQDNRFLAALIPELRTMRDDLRDARDRIATLEGAT